MRRSAQPGVNKAPAPLLARSAMASSPVVYLSATRTTLCDIQCTTNTPLPTDEPPPPPESLKVLAAVLPYDRPYNGMVGPMRSSTKFQKLKVDDSRLRKTAELKRDKEAYFRRLQQEKIETTQMRNNAATKIQAAFRGYRVRPKKRTYIPKRKPKAFLTHFEIYDELCRMAADLHLEPIPGLNLEFRTKASKRQLRIENAASFRIQRFFKMLYQRSVSQVVLRTKRLERIHRAAKTITRAIRYVIAKKFVKRVDNMKRVQCSTVIQKIFRGYRARMRVKEMRKKKFQDFRRNEAAVVIQRNLSSRSKEYSSMANVTMKTLRSFRKMVTMVSDRITSILLEEFLQQAVDNYLDTFARVLATTWKQSEERVLAEEIDELLSEVVGEWALEQLRLIEIESMRIAEERARFLEEMAMAEEEEFSRQCVSQSPVITRAMIEEMAIESIGAELVDAVSTDMLENIAESERRAAEEQQRMEREREEELRRETLEREEQERTEREKMEKAERESLAARAALQRKELFTTAVASFVQNVTGAGVLTVSQILASSQVLDNGEDNFSMCRLEIDALVSVEPSSHLEEMSFDAAHLSILDSSLAGETEMTASTTLHDQSYLTEDYTAETATVASAEEEDETHETASQSSETHSEAHSEAHSETSTLNPATTASRAALSIKEIAQYTAQAKHQRAVEELNPIMAKIEKKLVRARSSTQLSPREIHALLSKHSVVYSILGLLKARNLFALGAFEESKLLLDAVRKIREDTLGDGHYLVGEVLFFLAEWHRATASFDEAESLFLRANEIFAADVENYNLSEETLHRNSVADSVPTGNSTEGGDDEEEEGEDERDGEITPSQRTELSSRAMDLLNDASSVQFAGESQEKRRDSQSSLQRDEEYSQSTHAQTQAYTENTESQPSFALPSPTVFKLYHRNLIAYTELLRQRGQYYKSYELLKKAQASLLFFKQFDMVSFEVKEDFLVSLIATFVARGHYAQAIALHQELLDKRRVHYGLRHPKIASSMAALGRLLLLRAQFGEAANLIEESLSIRYEFYGNRGFGFNPDSESVSSLSTQRCSHPAIAAGHLLKAEGFLALGRYAEALIEANCALSIFALLFKRRTQGLHPSLAQCLITMGKAYNLMGEPLLAKHALEDALHILRSKFSAEVHVKTLETLSQLATACMLRGLFPIATDTLQFVIERRETLAQMMHAGGSGTEATSTNAAPAELLFARCQRALCLAYTARIQESKAVLKTSISSLQGLLGQQHPLVSAALLCFAETSKLCGNHADARALGGLAYDVYTALHGEEHEFICTIMRESADNLRLPGFYAEAMQIVSLACDVSVRLSSTAPPLSANNGVAHSLSALSSSSLLGTGPAGSENILQGRLLLLRAVVLRDSAPLIHWQDFTDNAYRSHTRAQFVVANADYDESERLLQLVAGVFRAKGGDNCAFYLLALMQLGELYRMQRNFNAAERYLLTALNIVGPPGTAPVATESTSSPQLTQIVQLLSAYTQAHLSASNSSSAGSNSVSVSLEKEPLPRFASEGVDCVFSRQGLFYAEALLLYCVFLVDIRQYESASRLLKTNVLPLLRALVGERHVLWIYASAIAEVCVLFLQWETEGSFASVIQNTIVRELVDRSDASHSHSHSQTQSQSQYQSQPYSQSQSQSQSQSNTLSHSTDYESCVSVVSGMLHEMRASIAALPAVQAMQQFWTVTGFSTEHVWLRRLQTIHYSFIDAVVFLSERSAELMNDVSLSQSMPQKSSMSFPSDATSFASVSASVASSSSRANGTADDNSTAPSLVSFDDHSHSHSLANSQSASFTSASMSMSANTDPSYNSNSFAGDSDTVVSAEMTAYAPQLSAISEGEDGSGETSSQSQSLTYDDSMFSSQRGSSLSRGSHASSHQSQTLTRGESGSGLQDSDHDHDDQSDFETRSYISYISHLSRARGGDGLRSARSRGSMLSLTPRERDRERDRDSPRSVVSGRSLATSTHSLSAYNSNKLSQQIEDETVNSWVSEYYSASQSATHLNSASYMSKSIAQDSLSQDRSQYSLSQEKSQYSLSQDRSQYSQEDDDGRSEEGYESEEFERLDDDTYERSIETKKNEEEGDYEESLE